MRISDWSSTCALPISELLLAHPERALTPAEAARIEAAVARRAAREPVSRILGEREFWSLPFGLNGATLDPRPDSETLVAAVLARSEARRVGKECGSKCRSRGSA